MQKFDSINVIPFIDIMLVLLAIVLTTATFVSNGQLDITLPTATSSTATTDAEKVEISIDRDEKLYLDGSKQTLEQIELALSTKSTDTQVNLFIDETVEFKQFVSVIDLLKALNLEKVSIVTRKVN